VLGYHAARWTPQRAAVNVKATTDPSADPTYLVEGRQIVGEDAYVPGDGCRPGRSTASGNSSHWERHGRTTQTSLVLP
jgi:hypothetical protein